MNIEAPLIVKEWLNEHRAMMLKEDINVELRLPPENDTLNKATIRLDANSILASLTVWGSGMVEYIVMHGESDDDIESTDVECVNRQDVAEKLDSFFQDFLKLIAEY